MTYTIRPATAADAAAILGFIRDLADFEKAVHMVEATEETVAASLFGPDAVARAAICEAPDGAPAGYAVWFLTYSTWQARNALYLEDLYVAPQHRGAGVGRLLLRHLARIALAQGCGRFEWSVLDWNEPAIRVYEAVGAEAQPEWIRYRLAGDALRRFAEG